MILIKTYDSSGKVETLEFDKHKSIKHVIEDGKAPYFSSISLEKIHTPMEAMKYLFDIIIEGDRFEMLKIEEDDGRLTGWTS